MLATSLMVGISSLDEVVQAMTLEEKVKLVRGTGMDMGDGGPTVGQTEDRVPGAAGTTFAVPRLGIPSVVLADGPAGLRIAPRRDNDGDNTYHATAFPIANLLSSTWDLKLVEKVGRAIGLESKEYGVDVLLAPALNIHRFALGGRNFEYYSEDPLLSGKMAASMVNGIQAEGVGTSLKHFVANNHEWNRNTIDVQLSERALREIYLRGFEIAVKESQPWTLMSSYNKVNGTYTSQSHYLLTEVLRDQWGFNGVVMTDWFGGKSPIAEFMPTPALIEFPLELARLKASAKKYAAAIITIGRSSGEFVDRETSDFYITKEEHAMLDMVSDAFRKHAKPVIVILNVGGVIETASWEQKADAILLAYQPGQEAGNAIADVLLGRTNPSGKLPDTWPLELIDYPAAKGFPGIVTDTKATPEGPTQSLPAKVSYDDDIMVGYRYFNTSNAEVAYPFGFGLSYTTFSYSDMTISSSEFTGNLVVTIKVTNNGKVTGKEVAQLYVSAPQHALKKPASELRGFTKTKQLQPGESEVLRFEISARDLTSFDEQQNVWLASAGEYTAKIGSSSREIKQEKVFSLKHDMLIQP